MYMYVQIYIYLYINCPFYTCRYFSTLETSHVDTCRYLTWVLVSRFYINGECFLFVLYDCSARLNGFILFSILL